VPIGKESGAKVTERAVHLVGSFPLASSEEVFDLCCGHLAGLTPRLPDGEPGIRNQWIEWQSLNVLPNMAALEVGGEGHIPNIPPFPTYRIKPGLTVADVRFPPLGYAAAAIASFALFKSYKAAGRIAPEVRFQVSLPTPFVVSWAYFTPETMRSIWPVYEAAMVAEIEAMAAALPHDELAIQWDVAAEVTVCETPFLQSLFSKDELIAALVRVIDQVPGDVQVGIHLCYGDPGGKHVLQPKDLGLVVELANTIAAAASHPLAWIHMPVPADRSDPDYFRPLATLDRRPETAVFLGLVHLQDGTEGAARRIRVAEEFLAGFGIATECGLGRRPRETVGELIALHGQIARSA
jgi:hypothetical protein